MISRLSESLRHAALSGLMFALISCAGKVSQPKQPPPSRPPAGWIVFVTWPGNQGGGPVYKAKLDGSELQSLNVVASYPKWSPAGGLIVGRDPWVGGASPNVSMYDTSGQRLYRFVLDGLQMEWRPDGNGILSGNAVADLRIRPLPPFSPLYIPPFYPQSFAGDSIVDVDMLAWAADTLHLFVRGDGPGAPGEDRWFDYYILNASTGKLEARLTHSHYMLPGTSPDSTLGPFFRLSPDGRSLLGGQSGHFINVVDIASGQERRVTSQFDDCCGHWAPDDRTIFFLRRDPAAFQPGYVSRWLLYRTSLDSIGLERKVMDKEVYDTYYDIQFE